MSNQNAVMQFKFKLQNEEHIPEVFYVKKKL